MLINVNILICLQVEGILILLLQFKYIQTSIASDGKILNVLLLQLYNLSIPMLHAFKHSSFNASLEKH